MIGMDDGARHWLLRMAKSNLWRVGTFYDLSDLIQDGFLIWYKVVNRYEVQPGRVRTRAHLMALFKRSYMNHLHDLASDRTKVDETLVSDLIAGSNMISEYDIWDRYVKAPVDELDHSRLLVELDPIAKQAIMIMESDEGARLLQAPRRRKVNKPRETDAYRLGRKIGPVADGLDIMARVKTALLSV